MKRLPRILQIIWMLIAVVSIFEAFSIFSSDIHDKTSGYLFVGLTLFAGIRYGMLRRKQYQEEKSREKYK